VTLFRRRLVIPLLALLGFGYLEAEILAHTSLWSLDTAEFSGCMARMPPPTGCTRPTSLFRARPTGCEMHRHMSGFGSGSAAVSVFME